MTVQVPSFSLKRYNAFPRAVPTVIKVDFLDLVLLLLTCVTNTLLLTTCSLQVKTMAIFHLGKMKYLGVASSRQVCLNIADSVCYSYSDAIFDLIT